MLQSDFFNFSILRFIRFGIVPFNHFQLHYFTVEEILSFVPLLYLFYSLNRSLASLLNFNAFPLNLAPRLRGKVMFQYAVISSIFQNDLN